MHENRLEERMTRNKLSIYLLKEGISNIEDIFEYRVKILQKYSDSKIAYYVPSNVHAPVWLNSFFKISFKDLKQANSKVVLLVNLKVDKKNYRMFALTFGYSKNLFKEDVLEERFGLKVLLNSVNADDLKKISKTSIGGNQKQSQEQIPKKSNIAEFGFNLDRDLIRNVTAKTIEDNFEKGLLTGGDIFSITVERDVDNIEEFLKFCHTRFKQTVYRANFEWIDNITEVRDSNEKSELEKVLLESLKKKDENVWMAVPEVITWETIKCFKYNGSHEEFNDIHIEKVMETFKVEVSEISQLKNRKIEAVSVEDESKAQYKWSFYKCIIAEFDVGGNAYCLNNGKWYKIDKDFRQKVNAEYETIKISDIKFIPYDNKGELDFTEDNYNEQLVNSLKNACLIHKIGEISYGGGQGNKIEVCDVMTNDKVLIHVKKNEGSAPLSHLFNQATVSAEALLDNDFREKFFDKLKNFKYDAFVDKKFNSNSYKVVIAIINKFTSERPKIPFFSRVSIRYAVRAISNLGYKVEIKNIDIT
jgi:uncharacterized protein (TIGR04141 family)